MVALVGLVKVIATHSSSSMAVSPTTDTVTVWRVSPGANVTVPVAATKSSSVANSGFPAPGEITLHVAVTGTGDGADNVTGTSASVVPVSPSSTATPPGTMVTGPVVPVPGRLTRLWSISRCPSGKYTETPSQS